jgi:hypothetical protein
MKNVNRETLARVKSIRRAMKYMNQTAGYLLRKSRTKVGAPRSVQTLWRAITIMDRAAARIEKEGDK